MEEQLIYEDEEISLDEENITRVRKAMERHGLTQADLALLIDVQPWTITSWLQGVRKISSARQAKLDYLLTLDKKADLAISMAFYEAARISRGMSIKTTKRLRS